MARRRRAVRLAAARVMLGHRLPPGYIITRAGRRRFIGRAGAEAQAEAAHDDDAGAPASHCLRVVIFIFHRPGRRFLVNTITEATTSPRCRSGTVFRDAASRRARCIKADAHFLDLATASWLSDDFFRGAGGRCA